MDNAVIAVNLGVCSLPCTCGLIQFSILLFHFLVYQVPVARMEPRFGQVTLFCTLLFNLVQIFWHWGFWSQAASDEDAVEAVGPFRLLVDCF